MELSTGSLSAEEGLEQLTFLQQKKVLLEHMGVVLQSQGSEQLANSELLE